MESIDAAGDTPVPEEKASPADIPLEDAGNETKDDVNDEAEPDSMLIEPETVKADAETEDVAKETVEAPYPAPVDPEAMEVETKVEGEREEDAEPVAKESAKE